MSRWYVQVPIVGFVGKEVEALTESAAIDQVMMSDLTFNDIEEWDVIKTVARGNVCHAPINDAWAEEIDEINDEEAF